MMNLSTGIQRPALCAFWFAAVDCPLLLHEVLDLDIAFCFCLWCRVGTSVVKRSCLFLLLLKLVSSQQVCDRRAFGAGLCLVYATITGQEGGFPEVVYSPETPAETHAPLTPAVENK